MKRIIALLLVAIMLLCVTGCDKKQKAKAVPKSQNIDHSMAYNGEIPAAYLPYEEGEFTSFYDGEADTLREKIINFPDSKPLYDKTYYISNNGDDDNDGLTPKTAWATTKNAIYVTENSNLLFERGGVYRGGFLLRDNVYYGAYGKGAKPQILGSPQNYADESLWKNMGDDIWKFTTEKKTDDVGLIVFDHGKFCGVRAETKYEIEKDYAYYFENGEVLLHLSKGNPASVHKDIELTLLSEGTVLRGAGLQNTVIENLCIKYGNFAITTGGNSDGVTIRGCEIGYIGGCHGGDTRWGNGVEIWGNSKNILIENCWVYQCYDAGLTHQCSTASYFENITYEKNLIEFCQYPIEFFNGYGEGAYCENIYYTNNIIRFAGYQVFDPKKRFGSNSSATACMTLSVRKNDYKNFIITGNIMDTSYGYMVRGYTFNNEGYPTVYGNYYVQQTGLSTYFWEYDRYPIVPSIKNNLPVTSQSDFEAKIQYLDTAPKAVTFIENKKQ